MPDPDGFRGSAVDPEFRADVLSGLAGPVRSIPARWFYDRRGSELFEAITQLPEYYPTRTERSLLEARVGEVAGIAGRGSAVIEFGSGASTKTRILLDAVQPRAYVPIDISGEFLREAASILQAEFPSLPIFPVEADFTRPLILPKEVDGAPKLGFFPGSTIGNLIPAAAVDLLRAMRATLGVGAWLLIGFDRAKDVATLIRAYDDSAGVTAEFNLNLLRRINRELRGTIPLEAFRHRAIWNERLSRIEMHLETVRDVSFEVDGARFRMAAGETIHSENSHKYGDRDAHLLLVAGGWTVVREWSDPAEYFTIILARADEIWGGSLELLAMAEAEIGLAGQEQARPEAQGAAAEAPDATELARLVERLAAKLDELERQLDEIPPSPAGIGHNAPPVDIGLPPYDEADRSELRRTQRVTREEIGRPRPDLDRLSTYSDTFKRIAVKIARWSAAKADLAVDEGIKAAVKFGAIAAFAALLASVATDLIALIEKLIGL